MVFPWWGKDHNHYHYHTRCILLIENYDQGLEKEERQQLISIEENEVKESLGLKRVLKESETYNYPNYPKNLQLTTNFVNKLVLN